MTTDYKNGMIRKLVAGLAVALAAGGILADGSPSLAEWRMAVATNGYVAVRGKVKVPQDVRERLWKAYREHIGLEGVQMSSPRLVATNEYGAVYDLPFTTADGSRQNFGVALSDGTARPLYRIGEETEGNANLAELNAAEYVAGMFLANSNGGARISSPGRVLSASDARVVLGFADAAVMAPFDEYLFFFIDDCPLSNWGHPARCVFVKSNLSSFAVLHVNMPARVTIDGVDVEMSPVGDGGLKKDNNGGGGTRTRSAARLMVGGAQVDFPAVTDGNSANCHALIVSGGGDDRNNHGRYWNDVCFAYNVLRQRYGLPRSNIKVLWASGNPNADLCWRTGRCYWETCLGAGDFPTVDLADFDQDGNNDVTGAATVKNITSTLNGYAASLKSTDQLFIFVTDHGDDGHSTSANEPASLVAWGGYLSDVKFAELTKGIKCPVLVALETCFSGGMVEEFLASGPNRVIATADGYDSSQAGNLAMDVWVYNFFSALCGYFPGGTYSTSMSGVAPVDVRSVGKVCNADSDNDGRISFFEAAQYASKNNPISGDHPENHASTANLHKKLFMTQYADAPAVVVKEKVLTPTLSPASGALGFAPCTVTASCGTSGATIRYTMDGSAPTGKSAVYSGGITLTDDATVTIRAFKSDMEASDAVSVAYTVRKTAPEKALITSVSQGDSSSGIVISWSGGAGTVSYDILRSETSAMTGAKAVASGLAASTSSWADLTAVPGRTYYYQIRSNNAYGSTLSAASQDAYLMLNPPASVTAVATARISTATVSISWSPSEGALYYRVYRKSSSGELTALGSWQASCSYADTVSLGSGVTTYSYYVKSAESPSGKNESSYSKEATVSITATSDGWQLIACTPWWSTTDIGTLSLSPGDKEEFSIRLQYTDGSFEEAGFVEGPTWRVKKGNGIELATKNGSYSAGWGSFGSNYRPPTLTVTVSDSASDQIATLTATFTAANGLSVTRDFYLIVSREPVVRELVIGGPDFITPGESQQMKVRGLMYGDTSWYGTDLDGSDVQWFIVGGSGATIDEYGELTAWPVSARTTVTVQARVDTLLGPVVTTKTFSVSPATIEQKTVELPPLGGSYTNYFGVLNTSTYGEFIGKYWLSGICWNSSSTPDPKDISWTISVGGGKNLIGLSGYLFLSFNADRNPGKDRETTFKLRWDGGGIDFKIFQREAPYANNPVVSGGANGTIAANSTSDGSVLHYATDGEEPSADSPVLSNSLSFEESTEFAVKAFGDWMQASDTVYADVVGKGSQWDEVEISFVPVQAGLSVPAKRTYKVNETFGELPSFPKTGGLFFKGWTLREGSDKLVSATDSVPSQDAKLYAVWSPVEEDKPSWVALPWNFKSAMAATMKVYDDMTGTYLDPSICIIGIEDADGVCRGSSENGFGDMQSELNGKDGLYVFGVYSQIESGTEEGLKIRIWNRQKGFMEVLNGNLSFAVDGELGSEGSPFVVHVETGFTVNFDANGGLVDETVRKVQEGAAVGELPTPSKEGFLFAGWYTARSGGSRMTSATTVSANTTVYAQWTAAWTLTFDANGGALAGDGKLLVEKGKAIGELPSPTWTGHVFLGWWTAASGGKQVAATTKVTADVTYYAHWRYVGAADENTIVYETEATYGANSDGTFLLDLSGAVGSLSEPKLTVKGLPSGLRFDAKTGLISGTATKPGVYKVTLSATNATVKKAVTATFELTVPNFTTDTFRNAGLNTEGTYELNAGVLPDDLTDVVNEVTDGGWSLKVDGLPAGLKFDAKKAVFSGVATKEGTFTVTFTATKGSGKTAVKEIATATFKVVFPTLTLDIAPYGDASATNKVKVTGGGKYQVGAKVTLKATPDKGSVFAGWFDADGKPISGAADYRAASYAYIATDVDATLTAKFAKGTEDVASLTVTVTNATTAVDGTYELDLGACVESLSLPKLAVSGLPTGLKYDAKTLKVSGKATKPGVYKVKVAATNTSVKKATDGTTATFELTVPNFESDKMPGLLYAADAYGTVWCGVALDAGLVDCTPADGWAAKVAGLPAGLKYDAKTGKIGGIPTKAGAFTVTFTLSKKGEPGEVATITLQAEALPAWAVGTFDGAVLGKDAQESGGSQSLATIPLGLVQGLTVSSNGKISGKVVDADGTWTLSAASFDRYDAEAGAYVATVIGKSGKLSFTNEVMVTSAEFAGAERGEAVMIGDGARMEAVQNLWKAEPWKTAAKPFANKKLPIPVEGVDGAFTSATIELKFASSGAVTASGKFVTGVNEKTKKDIVYSATCSSTLIPQGGDGYKVYIFFPPKKDAKGNVTFAGYSAEIALEWNGTSFIAQE